MTEFDFRGDFIDGKFVRPNSPDGEFQVESPADLSDLMMKLGFEYGNIDLAVESAQRAYRSWAHLNQSERFEHLKRVQAVLDKRSEEFVTAISRETGKPLWDAQGEVSGILGKFDVTMSHSIRLLEEEKIEEVLPGVDGFIRYKPRGVMAVLGPFNFPGHLPMGHIIPALACGNTVVFKPSEKTPVVGQILSEIFSEADLPPGVFNMVQGLGESGRRLVVHEFVDGVLFTGSYGVGLKIKQETLNHHWKILALEMGGKNASIVWEDADIEKAVYECLVGAFMTSGQRCSCSSRLILHKNIKEKFLDKFYQAAKRLEIGHWSENPFMGPLISAEAVEKYLRFQEIAARENAEPLMRGKAFEAKHKGHYVTPSIHLVPEFNPKSVYQQTEIFGPNVAVFEVDDFDQALEINNSTGFGLVMALFTKDRLKYDKALIDAKVGLLNWNRSTNRASSKLPFGGMGKSGNDRASAHHAVLYSSVPVACLEDSTAFDPQSVLPGLHYGGDS